MPSRVRSLCHISRGGIGIGVGVGVKHTHNLAPFGFGFSVGSKVRDRVDAVDACTSRHVRGLDDPFHLAGNRVADQQSAALVRNLHKTVCDHLGKSLLAQHEPGTLDTGATILFSHLGISRLVQHGCRLPFPLMGPRPNAKAGTVGRTGSQPKSQAKKKAAIGPRKVAQNRRARHEYDILETFECGMELKGGEVKSLRMGQATLQDAYARVDDGELWLVGCHIAPYEYSSGFGYVEPDRRRKLLLHREQIDELQGRVAQQSLTLVPLSIYFKEGRAKIELALARGRRLYDKRHAIAARDASREAARAIKEARR